MVERLVRPSLLYLVRVVFSLPGFKWRSELIEVAGLACIQTLTPQPSAQALYVAVLHGLLDMDQAQYDDFQPMPAYFARSSPERSKRGRLAVWTG